jgi:hypothetical protein
MGYVAVAQSLAGVAWHMLRELLLDLFARPNPHCFEGVAPVNISIFPLYPHDASCGYVTGESQMSTEAKSTVTIAHQSFPIGTRNTYHATRSEES